MPDHIFLSSAFPSAFQSTLTTLTLPSVRIVLDALDTVRAIVGHDALHDPSDQYLSPAQHAAFPSYAASIRAVVEGNATQLVQLLLDVLVGGGEDEPHNVLTILRLLSIQFPAVLAQTVPGAVERLPQRAAGAEEKQEFIQRFSTCVPFSLCCAPSSPPSLRPLTLSSLSFRHLFPLAAPFRTRTPTRSRTPSRGSCAPRGGATTARESCRTERERTRVGEAGSSREGAAGATCVECDDEADGREQGKGGEEHEHEQEEEVIVDAPVEARQAKRWPGASCILKLVDP